MQTKARILLLIVAFLLFFHESIGILVADDMPYGGTISMMEHNTHNISQHGTHRNLIGDSRDTMNIVNRKKKYKKPYKYKPRHSGSALKPYPSIPFTVNLVLLSYVFMRL